MRQCVGTHVNQVLIFKIVYSALSLAHEVQARVASLKMTREVENIHKLGGSILVSDRGNPPHSEIAKVGALCSAFVNHQYCFCCCCYYYDYIIY